jgi:hypothetical protein
MAILAIHTGCFKLLILAISCKNLGDEYPDTAGSMAMLIVLVGASLRASPLTLASVGGTLLTAALIVAGHRGNWADWRKRPSWSGRV